MAPFVKSVPMSAYGASPGWPGWVDTRYLNDANAHSYVVPSTCNWALVVANGAFWGSITGTAAVPTNDESAGGDPLYVPAGVQMRLEAGETLSLIRAGSSTVTVSIGVYK